MSVKNGIFIDYQNGNEKFIAYGENIQFVDLTDHKQKTGVLLNYFKVGDVEGIQLSNSLYSVHQIQIL